jgi:hypothetical protein
MPSYRTLQSVELNALVAYLQALRAAGADRALLGPAAAR